MNEPSKKIKLIEINSNLNSSYDLFICSGSYESRSKSIPLQFNSTSFNKVFVCYNKDHEQEVGKNALEIFKNFLQIGEYIELSSSDQLQIVDVLYKKLLAFLKKTAGAKILLDISTFKRQTLLILLRILRSILSHTNKITFIYALADEYSVGLKDEEKWLSKNITEVHSILGYSGILMPTKPIHLIILVGLEYERALSLIYEYEPAAVSIGYPSEQSSKHFIHHDLNKRKVQLIKEEYPSANIFEFSCNDPVKAKSEIENQIKLYEHFNNIISPMNNKLSTVASALVAFDNKSVQVSYASAAFYNIDQYSKPSDYCFLFELDNFIK